jgi:AraC-like DNA-binding protein
MIYFLIGMPLFGSLYELFFGNTLNEVQFLPALMSMLAAMLILAFFALRQPILYREELLELEQFRAKLTAEKKVIEKMTTPKKVEDNTTFNISKAEKQAYIKQIEIYFKETQPYLNPKIRMPELARSLHIPRHIFSYLINEHYQMNFFHWINQYRIEYAKQLLVSDETQYYTIDTIGKMAGFNSQSTFNKRFKEVVGKSPKQFQKEGVNH